MKVLFTTVLRPFGGKGEGDSVGAELFHAQITRAQGIYSPRQIIRCWGLDYIAENIKTPSVVLHYPSEEEFVSELKNDSYTHVGINFVVATFHKLKRMTALIRKHLSKAKILLGGYGTVLPDEELKPISDHICREEGIGFVRRLLGEVDSEPIKHPYAPIESPVVLSYPFNTKVMHVTGGLGCPNGCDFCCTSHYYNRKYVPFAKTGKELHRAMVNIQNTAKAKEDECKGFIVIDEDFFIHEKRAREFLECVRRDKNDFAIMGFGSLKGMSKFTADEIAEMGFDLIWVGFEAEVSEFHKLDGKKPEVLYEELKSRGIAILASMIMGFPNQNRESVMRDFDRLLKLEPTFSQFLIYFAFPGTPFYRYVIENDLYLPKYKKSPDYRKFDGFSMHLKHTHFRADELEELQRELYDREFQLLGPSLVRIARVWLNGYRNMKDSTNPLLKQRAERKKRELRSQMLPVFNAAIFGTNKETKMEAKRLFDEILEETGKISFKEKFFCLGTIPLAIWSKIRSGIDLLNQPSLLRVEYHHPGNKSPIVEKIEDVGDTIMSGLSIPASESD